MLAVRGKGADRGELQPFWKKKKKRALIIRKSRCLYL